MIKLSDNSKTTPRLKAQELILNKLSQVRGYWAEYESDRMTDKEITLIDEQLKKECDRIAKKFGFEKSWVTL